jgi:hypothetical protein
MVYLMQADILTVRNAVSSAVDIMQAMGSSVCNLLSKVSTRDPFTSIMKPLAKEALLHLLWNLWLNLCPEIVIYVNLGFALWLGFSLLNLTRSFQRNKHNFNIWGKEYLCDQWLCLNSTIQLLCCKYVLEVLIVVYALIHHYFILNLCGH